MIHSEALMVYTEDMGNTFGNAECMRLPCPAARIATLSGVVTTGARKLWILR